MFQNKITKCEIQGSEDRAIIFKKIILPSHQTGWHDIARLCTLTSFLQGPSTQGYAVSRARSEGWRHQFRGEARIVDPAATFPTRSKVTTSAGLRRRASLTSERRREENSFRGPLLFLSLPFSPPSLSTRILRRCNVLLDCIVTRSISVARLIYEDPRRFETLFTFISFC